MKLTYAKIANQRNKIRDRLITIQDELNALDDDINALPDDYQYDYERKLLQGTVDSMLSIAGEISRYCQPSRGAA